jgi:hypothetical protein
VHTRSILFVKPDYWLVIDRMESESDDQDHAFRMKIQLDKDLVTEQTGVRVLARNPSTGVGLHVQSFDGDASLEIVKGQKHPRIEGWLAVSENAWPAPAAIYTKQVRAPAGFQTLLFPERDGEAVSVDAAKSGSVLTAHIRREELELTDTFLISSCSTDAVRFEGRLAWARSVGRDVMCASLIDGDRLGLAKMGLDLVLERRGTICVTRTSDGEWEIFADLMNLPGIAGTLNGIGFRLEPGLKVRIGDAQLSPVTGAERSS